MQALPRLKLPTAPFLDSTIWGETPTTDHCSVRSPAPWWPKRVSVASERVAGGPWDEASTTWNPGSLSAKPCIADVRWHFRGLISSCSRVCFQVLGQIFKKLIKKRRLEEKSKTQGSIDFWKFFPSFSGLWYWEPMMTLLLSLDWFFFCLKTQHKTTLPLGNFFSSPFPDRIDRRDWDSLVLFQLLPFQPPLSHGIEMASCLFRLLDCELLEDRNCLPFAQEMFVASVSRINF